MSTKISKKSRVFTARSLPIAERVFHATAALRHVHGMLRQLAEEDLWYCCGKRPAPPAALGEFNETKQKELVLRSMWLNAVKFEIGVFGEEAVRTALFDLRREFNRSH